MTTLAIAIALAPFAALFLVMLGGFTRQYIAEVRKHGA